MLEAKTQDLHSSVLLVNQDLDPDSVEIAHHPLTFTSLISAQHLQQYVFLAQHLQ